VSPYRTASALVEIKYEECVPKIHPPTTAQCSVLEVVNTYTKAWLTLVKLSGEQQSHTRSVFQRARLVRRVRERVAKIIEDRTGYAKLTTTEDYADAIRGASGDKLLEDVLYVLLAEHARFLELGVLVEPPVVASTP